MSQNCAEFCSLCLRHKSSDFDNIWQSIYGETARYLGTNIAHSVSPNTPFTRYSRLSNRLLSKRFDNRFDNRLHCRELLPRVVTACTVSAQSGRHLDSEEPLDEVSSPNGHVITYTVHCYMTSSVDSTSLPVGRGDYRGVDLATMSGITTRGGGNVPLWEQSSTVRWRG